MAQRRRLDPPTQAPRAPTSSAERRLHRQPRHRLGPLQLGVPRRRKLQFLEGPADSFSDWPAQEVQTGSREQAPPSSQLLVQGLRPWTGSRRGRTSLRASAACWTGPGERDEEEGSRRHRAVPSSLASPRHTHKCGRGSTGWALAQGLPWLPAVPRRMLWNESLVLRGSRIVFFCFAKLRSTSRLFAPPGAR